MPQEIAQVPSVVYTMSYSELQPVDKDSGEYECWMTKESPNHFGEIVVASGCDHANFDKNPVVMFNHDYEDLPVAQSVGIRIVEGEGVIGRFRFMVRGMDSRADRVHNFWSVGYIRGVSIGFISREAEKIDPEEEDGFFYLAPRRYKKWELIEYSVVTIPAHQDALRRSFSFGDLVGSSSRRRRRRRKSSLVVPVSKPVEHEIRVLARVGEDFANDSRALLSQLSGLRNLFNKGGK